MWQVKLSQNIWRVEHAKKARAEAKKMGFDEPSANQCDLNRLMSLECSVCTIDCPNQQLTSHSLDERNLSLFAAGEKGWGLRSSVAIARGALVAEYLGEVMTTSEFEQRMKGIYAKDVNHYALKIDKTFVIDAARKGSIARFVNHSCEPNCYIEKLYVNGLPRMVLFASFPIAVDEEITFDYRFDSFEVTAQHCYCGSANCRKSWNGSGSSAEPVAGPSQVPIDESPRAEVIEDTTHNVDLQQPAIMEKFRDIEADNRDAMKMAEKIKNKYDVITKLTLISLKRGKGKFSVKAKYVLKKWTAICPSCSKVLVVSKDYEKGFCERFAFGTHFGNCPKKLNIGK